MSIELKIYSLSLVIAVVIVIICCITFYIMKPKIETQNKEDNSTNGTIVPYFQDQIAITRHKSTDENQLTPPTIQLDKLDQLDQLRKLDQIEKYTKPQQRKPVRTTGGNPKQFNSQCLKAHNNYRKMHGVPDLTIDKTLINFAKSRATTLKKTDVFSHAKDVAYGENLHFISDHSSYACGAIVEAWYNEIKDYNYNDPNNSKGTVGHFTQVVWKGSLKIGCAQAYSKAKKLYSVCSYYPPGNYVGEDKQNVLKPNNLLIIS